MKKQMQEEANSSNWTNSARKFLALRTKNFLRDAIIAAQSNGETEVVRLLENFELGKADEVLRLSARLSQKFDLQNQTAENLTVNLLKTDLSEPLLKTFGNFFGNEQRKKWKIGETACREAINISRRLEDHPCEAFYLLSLANGLFAVGEFSKAAIYFTEALEIYRILIEKEPSAYTSKLADTLNGLGAVQHYLGLFEKAVISYEEACRKYESLIKKDSETDASKLSTTWNNLGIAQRELNKLEDALESQKKSLAQCRKLAAKNPSAFEAKVAVTLNSLGSTQSRAGRFLESKRSFEEALEIRRRLFQKNPNLFAPLIAQNLNNLGLAYLDLGRYREAAEICKNALQEYQKLAEHDRRRYLPKVAQTRNNLGSIWGELKSHETAVEFYTSAVENYRELTESEPLSYEPLVATGLNNLGNSYAQLKRFREASNSYREALRRYLALAEKQPLVYRPYVAITMNNFGNLYILQRKWRNALDYYEKAKEIVEKLHENLYDLDLKKEVFQQNIKIYTGLFTCFTKLGEWTKALEVVEQGKSRSLIELLNLTNLRPKFSRNKIPTTEEVKELGKLTEKFKELSVKIRQINNELLILHQKRAIEDEKIKQSSIVQKTQTPSAVSGEEIEATEIKKTLLVNKRKGLRQKIRKFDKDFPLKAELLNVRQIFEISLKSNRVIVVFRVTAEGTFIFVIFPDRILKCIKIKDFTSKKLDEIARKWIACNSGFWRTNEREAQFTSDQSFASEENNRGQSAEQIKTILSDLYQLLLKPVHSLLKKRPFNEVLMIPNNALAILPLHAGCWTARNKTHYLIDKYTISYSTSVSVFKHAWNNSRNRRLKKSFLFVTNPKRDLKYSETEVNRIIENFGLTTDEYSDFRGRQAIKKNIKKILLEEKFNFYHFSCHGNYDPENAFSSTLILSDGEITLKEIMESNLSKAWLTTLSACKTGFVNYAELTDEHYGFPLGFIFAGCPSVLATLWSVDDKSTAELIEKVYRFLNAGNSKSEALRQAQIEFKKEKAETLYSSPFFWAGFQHYGV